MPQRPTSTMSVSRCTKLAESLRTIEVWAESLGEREGRRGVESEMKDGKVCIM